MAKQPTNWRKKGTSTATGVDIDSAAVDYDSSTQLYGSTETPQSVIKQRTSWGKRLKVATRFLRNPAAVVSALIYDSANAYDAPLTYDSIVVGEPYSTGKKPTAWRQQ